MDTSDPFQQLIDLNLQLVQRIEELTKNQIKPEPEPESESESEPTREELLERVENLSKSFKMTEKKSLDE